jgi:hypothetical protein
MNYYYEKRFSQRQLQAQNRKLQGKIIECETYIY